MKSSMLVFWTRESGSGLRNNSIFGLDSGNVRVLP